jgi:hypothetical protein
VVGRVEARHLRSLQVPLLDYFCLQGIFVVMIFGRVFNRRHHVVVPTILTFHEIGCSSLCSPITSSFATSSSGCTVVRLSSSKLLLLLFDRELEILLSLHFALVCTYVHELILSDFTLEIADWPHRTQIIDHNLVVLSPKAAFTLEKDAMVHHLDIFDIQRLKVLSLLFELGLIALFSSLVRVGHI